MRITNNLNLPQPFVSAVESDYRYKDKRYSVTSVLKGTKEAILQRRHADDIEQDVSDMIWLIFGTAMHSVLENAQEKRDELKETKIEIDMPNGYVLSGQQDLYSESEKMITDYKTGTVWKVIYDDWKDYQNQCLCYAYMFNKLGFPCDKAQIVMVLKDWSASKAKFDPSYPQHPVYIKKFKFTEIDFEKCELMLKTKFNEIEAFEKLDDDQIPDCSEEERWAEPTKYAVMKQGRKSAVKLFDRREDAIRYLEDLDNKYYLETREGTDKKCCNYCSCNKFCSYWKEKYEGRLHQGKTDYSED